MVYGHTTNKIETKISKKPLEVDVSAERAASESVDDIIGEKFEGVKTSYGKSNGSMAYQGDSYSNFADGMSEVDRAIYIQNSEAKFFEEFSERSSASGLNDVQISEAYNAMKAEDYKKMASYFDTSSPVDGAVFWSGNKEGAAVYADSIGGTIMEQTPGGQVFDGWRGLQGMYPEWNTGMNPQKPIWDALSSQYANEVQGVATYVHEKEYIGEVWSNIEKPILEENDVIIYEVILNAE